jgi:hypothetical protein
MPDPSVAMEGSTRTVGTKARSEQLNVCRPNAGLLLAHMDDYGVISVYHVGGGDCAYCFGPDEDDDDDKMMEHQGFAVGDSGLYLASAHGQDILMWSLGSSKPTLKGSITAHQAQVVQVAPHCSLKRLSCPCVGSS